MHVASIMSLIDFKCEDGIDSARAIRSRLLLVCHSQQEFSLPDVQATWRSQHHEFCYWVPQVDIEGTVPREIFGTFFRNGPGINEVRFLP